MTTPSDRHSSIILDRKIREKAKLHGINISGTARRAVCAKIEQCEKVEKLLQNTGKG